MLERVVRLAGAWFWGRVEVKVDQRWGTVCKDEFDIKDARVFCRYLGFSGALGIFNGTLVGPGEGPVILSDMMCKGNEETPFNCKQNEFEDNDCTHEEDAGIICTWYEKTGTVCQ